MIEKYNFTSIIINNEEYSNSVKVSRFGVEEWETVDNNLIQTADLRQALLEKPNVIIVGAGNINFSEITPEAEDFLNEINIRLLIEPTEKAIQSYNVISRIKNTVGLFRLC